jgi:hypothetical protein
MCCVLCVPQFVPRARGLQLRLALTSEGSFAHCASRRILSGRPDVFTGAANGPGCSFWFLGVPHLSLHATGGAFLRASDWPSHRARRFASLPLQHPSCVPHVFAGRPPCLPGVRHGGRRVGGRRLSFSAFSAITLSAITLFAKPKMKVGTRNRFHVRVGTAWCVTIRPRDVSAEIIYHRVKSRPHTELRRSCIWEQRGDWKDA